MKVTVKNVNLYNWSNNTLYSWTKEQKKRGFSSFTPCRKGKGKMEGDSENRIRENRIDKCCVSSVLGRSGKKGL